jgi:hypothetical protein
LNISAFSFTDPAVHLVIEAFMDWFTDVRDAGSTGFLADVAWALSFFGLSEDGDDPAVDREMILGVVADVWEAFQRGEVLKAEQGVESRL